LVWLTISKFKGNIYNFHEVLANSAAKLAIQRRGSNKPVIQPQRNVRLARQGGNPTSIFQRKNYRKAFGLKPYLASAALDRMLWLRS
jgi:hypothetical protein